MLQPTNFGKFKSAVVPNGVSKCFKMVPTRVGGRSASYVNQTSLKGTELNKGFDLLNKVKVKFICPWVV